MEKFKAWLYKANEEGVTNFDAITMSVVILIAGFLPLALR